MPEVESRSASSLVGEEVEFDATPAALATSSWEAQEGFIHAFMDSRATVTERVYITVRMRPSGETETFHGTLGRRPETRQLMFREDPKEGGPATPWVALPTPSCDILAVTFASPEAQRAMAASLSRTARAVGTAVTNCF